MNAVTTDDLLKLWNETPRIDLAQSLSPDAFRWWMTSGPWPERTFEVFADQLRTNNPHAVELYTHLITLKLTS